MKTGTFPSDALIDKHFGSGDRTQTVRNDVGTTALSMKEELRRHIDFTVINGPKHFITAEDRSFTGTREFVVFKEYKVCDTQDVSHFREVLDQQIPLDAMREDFERDLYDELEALVLEKQPFAKVWWEWFAVDGTLGVRFKADAKDGENEPPKTLKLFSDRSESYPM